MKRLISIILCAVMAFSCVSISAQEGAGERVEITFSVGDSIIKINGADVEVETPFIAGEGTTLVPLRVITEAFGATVEWIAETRSIRLEYREVQVLLQIDNPVAQVNDHSETLAVAPMLVNNTTMVPLRFISETFGATVGWNEEERRVSVVKEALVVGETVKGGISEPYVGDSYYNWSIRTPQNYNLVQRRFDGSSTVFSNSAGSDMLYISVIPNIRNYTLERVQMDADELFEGGSLQLATFAVDPKGLRYTYSYGVIQGQYQHIVQYVQEGLIYRAIILCPTDGASKEYLKSILSSFELECNMGKGVYDLSNVSDNNTRLFTNELFGATFEIPAYFLTVNTDRANEIYLATGLVDDKSIVQLNIYSKLFASAQKYAEEERENDSEALNKNITGIGKLQSYEVDGIEAVGYDIKIKDSTAYDGVWAKRFFEKGEYVYCLSIRECNGKSDGLIDTIMSGCSFEEINVADAGLLPKWDTAASQAKEYSAPGFVVSAPANWQQIDYSDKDAIALEEKYTNSEGVFFYQYLGEYADMFATLQQFSGAQAEAMGAEIVEEVDVSVVNGERYYYFTMKSVSNGTPVYITHLMTYKRGFLYRGVLLQYELYAFGGIRDEFAEIVVGIK